ncbi:MAG: bifunctional nuclease family protein [Kosmotogaceae bacterium]
MLKVKIRGLAIDQSNTPVVILETEKSDKGFGIWIGRFEAESLALAVSGKEFPRPLTYDLLLNCITSLGAAIEKAVIHSIEEDVYHAFLYLIKENGENLTIDARPSDCLVLAVKSSFPIYVEEEVFEQSAIDLQKLGEDYPENTAKRGKSEEFKQFIENIQVEDFKRYLRRKDDDTNEDET